jgi:hypothetical protein
MLTGLEWNSALLKQLSMLTLFLVLTPICLLFFSRSSGRRGGGFDAAAGLLATVNLIFMLLSYKTYPWYFSAFLLFVLHTLLSHREASIRELLPLMLLGSVSNLEPRLWMLVRARDPGLLSGTGGTLFALDVAVLGAVLYWTILCLRRSLLAESPSQVARPARSGP